MNGRIPEELSLYLDLVRFLSACVVLLHHTWPLVFPNFPLPWPGHSAVVVFFVLSGYVIAHSCRQGTALRSYVNHRLARVLPVSLCSLFLCVCLYQFAGTTPIPNSGSMRFDWQSIVINLFFLGQSWIDLTPTFNPPFWSLNYEVWYYVIYGVWIYSPSRLLVFFVVLIAGPKIILLLPVWLLGVALYQWQPLMTPRCATYSFVSTSILSLAFIWFDVSIHIREYLKSIFPIAMSYAHGSNQFIGDFILGLIVAANFAAVASMRVSLLKIFAVPIRYLSSFTFSIYIFHMPLAVLIWNGIGAHSPLMFFSIMALFIYFLCELTERRSHFYKSIFSSEAKHSRSPKRT